jgi:hypothetical protein
VDSREATESPPLGRLSSELNSCSMHQPCRDRRSCPCSYAGARSTKQTGHDHARLMTLIGRHRWSNTPGLGFTAPRCRSSRQAADGPVSQRSTHRVLQSALGILICRSWLHTSARSVASIGGLGSSAVATHAIAREFGLARKLAPSIERFSQTCTTTSGSRPGAPSVPRHRLTQPSAPRLRQQRHLPTSCQLHPGCQHPGFQQRP